MSYFGFTLGNIDLSHIHLAVNAQGLKMYWVVNFSDINRQCLNLTTNTPNNLISLLAIEIKMTSELILLWLNVKI